MQFSIILKTHLAWSMKYRLGGIATVFWCQVQFNVYRFFLPGERLQQVTVYLGEDSGSFSVTYGTFTGPGENAEVIHIVCNKPATGRFVKIQMNNFQRNRYLTLCEISILVWNKTGFSLLILLLLFFSLNLKSNKEPDQI